MKKIFFRVFVIALALTFITPIPAEAKEENTQYCYREKSNTTTKSEGYRSKSKATTKNKGYRAKSKAPSGSTSKGKSSKKSYDPYDADKYTSADDFAEDNYEEFYDYEDDAEDDDDAYDAAVDYWNSKNKQ
jgi:hypothetical protein